MTNGVRSSNVTARQKISAPDNALNMYQIKSNICIAEMATNVVCIDGADDNRLEP